MTLKHHCDFPFCHSKVSPELIPYTSRHHTVIFFFFLWRFDFSKDTNSSAVYNPLRPPCSDLECIKIHSQCHTSPVCYLFNFLLAQTLDSRVYIRWQQSCFCIWTMLTSCHRGRPLQDRRYREARSLRLAPLCFPVLPLGQFCKQCFVYRIAGERQLEISNPHSHVKGTVKFSTNARGDCQVTFFSLPLVCLPLSLVACLQPTQNICSTKQHRHTILAGRCMSFVHESKK